MLAALDSQDDSSRGSDDGGGGVNGAASANGGVGSGGAGSGITGSGACSTVFDKDFKGVIPESERSSEWDGREASLFRTLLPVFPGASSG